MVRKSLMLCLGLILLLSIVGGCAQEQRGVKEYGKMKEYYLKHDDALRAKISECQKMSTIEATKNMSCSAAQAAMDEKPMENPLEKEWHGKPLQKFK